MSLQIGIIGLPNVGKSTIFNALTKNQAEASNYPFCTIEPNVGIVEVPDERLRKIADIVPTNKIVPAIVKFIDIAGIVKGASEGQGLGNKFLTNIRETDAIAEVVRIFEDTNVTHVSGGINPNSDISVIKTELILADLETVEKRISKLEKEVKGSPKVKENLDRVKHIQSELGNGKAIRELELSEKELEGIKDLNLLTAKPHIYILNVSENQLTEADKIKEKLDSLSSETVIISAKIENELNDLTDKEKEEYLAQLGETETGLDKLICLTYRLLGLQSFFTAGEKEIKAWTVPIGTTAPQAAGTIHTDFEKGFIKAETVSWKNLIEHKGWNGARNAGKVRLEGRDYFVQDGDVMIFKFNV